MEYSAEDISPVRKKVVITTEAQEVEAAIMGAVALYKTSVQLDGFRKGKVPASVIEQRFRDKIYEEARQDLINVHINDGRIISIPMGDITNQLTWVNTLAGAVIAQTAISTAWNAL